MIDLLGRPVYWLFGRRGVYVLCWLYVKSGAMWLPLYWRRFRRWAGLSW